MIEIAICDDEKIMTSIIEERLHDLGNKHKVQIETDVFFDGVTLTDYIVKENRRYDIIYIDIEMKNQNGVEAAKKIREIDKYVLLIYVTNHESFAKEVFEVSAFRFITKPICTELFERYFLSAIERIQVQPEYFKFQYNKIHYKIEIKNIMYFQSDRRVTYINLESDVRKCYEKLNSIEEKLLKNNICFFRIHQSFLVNPRYVEVYMYDTMKLKDGTTLSISENRRKLVNELYCKIKGDSIIV